MMGRCLLLFLLMSGTAWAAPDGRTRVSIDVEETIWVGQRVLVHLDLMSNGFSFSNQRFDLPQISGGILIQTDSSTLKLTEQIDGESWQILRYDLSFFGQRDGVVDIPSFGVHFSASAGFGQAEASFDLTTEALSLQVDLPPGADPLQPVITSSRLTVQEQWQPDQIEFKVGESLTRTIIIDAEDVSGNALPTAPDQAVEGIDQLLKAPQVEDKTNRGTLSGHRREQVSYLFKQEGQYTLPGGFIAWWNPKSETLEQYQFEARSIEVVPDPLARARDENRVELTEKSVLLPALITILLVIVSAVLFWKWPTIQARRLARFNAEPAQFKRAIKACRQNDMRLVWSRVNEWLATAGISIPFEDELIWQELQRALVSQSADWTGDALKNSLISLRKDQRSQTKKEVYLNPLNP